MGLGVGPMQISLIGVTSQLVPL